MRIAALVLVTGLWTLMAGACLQNNPPGTSTAPTQLAVAVLDPNSDISVPQDGSVTVNWTAGNLTGEQAVATIIVRASDEIDGEIIAGGILVAGSGTNQTFLWNVAGFRAETYRITVRIDAGDETAEDTAGGKVTVSAAAAFVFTTPTGSASVDPDDPNSVVTIGWTASDASGDGSAELSLDLDSDHESGNEIVLFTATLSKTSADDSFDFSGTDESDAPVEAGTYFLFAKVSDGVNPAQFIEGLATITVAGAASGELAITKPDADTQFLTGDPALSIEYTLDEPNDVLVDVEVDTDDNHSNGNEITIFSQRLVAANTNDVTESWNGNDSAGNPVADGIYRLVLVVNRGTGTPETVEGPALVMRRSFAGEPLIGLLSPSTALTVTPGSFLLIEWRDDDPNGVAVVRLTVDDDAIPNEGTETGAAEMEILAGRAASGDGVQDTFQYKIPTTLSPGIYHVFAYIDLDGAAPFDSLSASGGTFRIADPNSP